MNFDTYQKEAAQFAVFQSPFYPYFGVMEELGELMACFSKRLRGDVDYGDDTKIKKEMGDVLWMLSAIAELNGFSLQEVAEMNIQKLTSRKERDVIKGSGDDR